MYSVRNRQFRDSRKRHIFVSESLESYRREPPIQDPDSGDPCKQLKNPPVAHQITSVVSHPAPSRLLCESLAHPSTEGCSRYC